MEGILPGLTLNQKRVIAVRAWHSFTSWLPWPSGRSAVRWSDSALRDTGCCVGGRRRWRTASSKGSPPRPARAGAPHRPCSALGLAHEPAVSTRRVVTHVLKHTDGPACGSQNALCAEVDEGRRNGAGKGAKSKVAVDSVFFKRLSTILAMCGGRGTTTRPGPCCCLLLHTSAGAGVHAERCALIVHAES